MGVVSEEISSAEVFSEKRERELRRGKKRRMQDGVLYVDIFGKEGCRGIEESEMSRREEV